MSRKKKAATKPTKKAKPPPTPPFSEADLDAADSLAEDLVRWMDCYQAQGDDATYPEFWAPLVNCLWRIDRMLNPNGLPCGHLHRDNHLAAAPPSIHLLRRRADRLIWLFGLQHGIAADDVEKVMETAREHLASVDYQLPLLVGEELGRGPEMPKVVVSDASGTIEYKGKTYVVDPDACELLQELIDAYPDRIGLTTDDRQQPKRITKKLPDDIKKLIDTNQKGSVLKP